MRPLGFWVLFLLAGAALVILSLARNCGVAPDSAYRSKGLKEVMHVGGAMAVIVGRKIKESSYGVSSTKSAGELGSIDVDDYPRFDPAPNAKAIVKAGPIEHGTPLMPYIPQPPPPSHAKHGSP